MAALLLALGGGACVDDDIPPRPSVDAPADAGPACSADDAGAAGGGGAGDDGGVVLLASASPCQGLDLVVSGDTLYWTEEATGLVRSVPTSGGAPTTIASGQVAPGALAVDGTSIYWVSGDRYQDIMKRSLACAAPSVFVPSEMLPDPLGRENQVNALLAANGWLYFSRYIYTYKVMTDGSGPPIPIGESPDSDRGSAGAFALSGTYLYQVELYHSAVSRERIDGKQNGLLEDGLTKQPLAPDRIATSQQELVTDAIAVVDDHVGWAAADSLWRKPGNTLDKDPANPPILIAQSSGGHDITGFAVSGTTVYFGEYSANTVQAVDFYGGAPRTVATGQSAPGQFAVDDKNVYWRTIDCQIVKHAKP